MPSVKYSDEKGGHNPGMVVHEGDIEDAFIGKLRGLKYTMRPDIRDRAALEANFREKFEALNRVHLTDAEFARLLDEIVTPDVFTAAKTLRQINSFTRDDGTPLNIACVFSPPAEGNPDVKQIQEDLPQEQADNEVEPDKKKDALKAIMADYNARYGTNHRLSEFDLYYQNVQKRIKDQQWKSGGSFQLLHSNKQGAGCSRHDMIDITIVVDMLLTGFDSKFLNTLYVDKTMELRQPHPSDQSHE